MTLHHRTAANAKIYDLIGVLWVQANWDRREDLAGPWLGLLAKGQGWRVFLRRNAPIAREGLYSVPVRLDRNYMFINTRGSNSAIHGLLEQLGVTYGTKAFVHHIAYALEGGSLPNDGIEYDRHHVNGNPFDNRASNLLAVPRHAHQAYNADHPASHKPLPEGWAAYLVLERAAAKAGNARQTVGWRYLARAFGWQRGRACKAARILAIVASRGVEGLSMAELIAEGKPYGIEAKNTEKLVAMLVNAKVPMLHKPRHGRYTLAEAALAERYKRVTPAGLCSKARIRGP